MLVDHAPYMEAFLLHGDDKLCTWHSLHSADPVEDGSVDAAELI